MTNANSIKSGAEIFRASQSAGNQMVVFRVEVSTSNRWHASRSALSGVRARDSLFGSKAFAKHWNNHGKQRSLNSDYIALESQFVGESDPR